LCYLFDNTNVSKYIKNYNGKRKSGCICHRCIVLVITSGWMMELETLPEINLILLHTEVN
jgi:hypothetical protein